MNFDKKEVGTSWKNKLKYPTQFVIKRFENYLQICELVKFFPKYILKT